MSSWLTKVPNVEPHGKRTGGDKWCTFWGSKWVKFIPHVTANNPDTATASKNRWGIWSGQSQQLSHIPYFHKLKNCTSWQFKNYEDMRHEKQMSSHGVTAPDSHHGLQESVVWGLDLLGKHHIPMFAACTNSTGSSPAIRWPFWGQSSFSNTHPHTQQLSSTVLHGKICSNLPPAPRKQASQLLASHACHTGTSYSNMTISHL